MECSPPTHSHPPSRGSDPAVHHHAIVGSPTPSPAPTHSLPSSKEKWTKKFEPVDVSTFIQDVGPTFDVQSYQRIYSSKSSLRRSSPIDKPVCKSGIGSGEISAVGASNRGGVDGIPGICHPDGSGEVASDQ